MKKRCLFALILICIILCGYEITKNSDKQLASNRKILLEEKKLTEEKVDLIGNIILSADSKGEFKDVISSVALEHDIELPFDWSCEDIGDRSFAYQMNGFLFLDYSYRLYAETSDSKYRDLIIRYMLDWIKSNPEPLVGSKWAWHDDATARRLFRMSYYYFIWKDYFGLDEQELVLESLKKQAGLLASDDFYTENHNHGMFQDMGLIVYSLLIASDEEKTEYLNLAKNRSQEYFNYVFTTDGVHKEHSPSYHINVSQKLLFFIGIYKGIDDAFCNALINLYNNSSEYITEIAMPDGTLPSIGDSARTKLENNIYSTSHYLYATTRGAQGEEPSDSYISQQGGYAVMRSSWTDDLDTATYILFIAATHSSTHKHGDDLSFILYHRGDLFVEAGNRDYNYEDPMTKYVYSGFGHNVLMVNDEAFPVKYGPSGSQNIYPKGLETKISDFDMESKIKYVEGEQYRFDGIVQKRRITYDKLKSKVLIKESLKGTIDSKATLIYHIAEGVEVKQVENGWVLSKSGEEIANVFVSAGNGIGFDLSTITGEEGEAPYYTWIFEGKKEPRLGSLLKIDTQITNTNEEIDLKIELK